jgi:hypothetical protein
MQLQETLTLNPAQYHQNVSIVTSEVGIITNVIFALNATTATQHIPSMVVADAPSVIHKPHLHNLHFHLCALCIGTASGANLNTSIYVTAQATLQ